VARVKGKNSWIELQLEIPLSLEEALANFLIKQGSPGIVQEDEKISGKFPEKRERLIAYFLNDQSWGRKKKEICSSLQAMSQANGTIFALRTKILKEQKWAESWKINFKPIRVSSRIVVQPPWEKYTARKGEIVIQIDPGLAFGTGTHPSTQLTLQILDEIYPSPSSKLSVLDVGAGSGILAIAAQKLGAKRIIALDIDPVAVASAKKNAALNGIEKEIDFRLGTPADLGGKFNLVLANLLPQELLPLASSLAERVTSRGMLVVSGFLRNQKEEIMAAFGKQNLTVHLSKEKKGWASLALQRKNCGK